MRAAIRGRGLAGKLVTVKVASRFNDFPKLLPRSMQPDLGIVMADAEGSADLIIAQPAKRTEHKGRAKGLRKSSNFAADAVAHFMYIEKYEKHLLRWHFYLYKPRGAWQINSVSFDDRIQSLVE